MTQIILTLFLVPLLSLILVLLVIAAIAQLVKWLSNRKQPLYKPSTHNPPSGPDTQLINSKKMDCSLGLLQKSEMQWMKDLSGRNPSSYAQSAYSPSPIPSEPFIESGKPEWSIKLLQEIEWKVFEDLSAAYYREKGIRAELTKLGADGGIDIKLFQDESGKPTSLVQCKAWNSQLVGVKPIREFLGVITHEKAAKGFFMSSKGFTADAIEIARTNRIILVDGVMFLTMIKRLSGEAQDRLMSLVTQGDYKTPSCPSCGIKMIRRTGKRGAFWGCRNFPRCRQILHVK